MNKETIGYLISTIHKNNSVIGSKTLSVKRITNDEKINKYLDSIFELQGQISQAVLELTTKCRKLGILGITGNEESTGWDKVPYPDEEEILEIIIEEVDSLESANWQKELTEFCTFSQKDLVYGYEACTPEEIEQLKQERETAKKKLAELQKNGINNNYKSQGDK